MRRNPAIPSICALAAFFGCLSLHGAHAETSSWSQRIETPDDPKVAPGKKPAAPATKPAGQKPAPSGKKPAGSTPSKIVPSTVPATGEDAAYLAFDQGQYLTALKLAQEAASRGDATANTLIGRIYEEGLGVPQNSKTAANWYARAAEMGDVPATFELALLLAQGKGVEKN